MIRRSLIKCEIIELNEKPGERMEIIKSTLNLIRKVYYKILDLCFWNYITDRIFWKHHIYGDPSRVKISSTANVNNALFNVASGTVTIEDFAFCAHNVMFITGTHDYSKTGKERQKSIPSSGRDILIKKGVWIGTNSTILGPCTIGENAVVSAHSLVNEDVPSNTVVGGVPARFLKLIE